MYPHGMQTARNRFLQPGEVVTFSFFACGFPLSGPDEVIVTPQILGEQPAGIFG